MSRIIYNIRDKIIVYDFWGTGFILYLAILTNFLTNN